MKKIEWIALKIVSGRRSRCDADYAVPIVQQLTGRRLEGAKDNLGGRVNEPD